MGGFALNCTHGGMEMVSCIPIVLTLALLVQMIAEESVPFNVIG